MDVNKLLENLWQQLLDTRAEFYGLWAQYQAADREKLKDAEPFLPGHYFFTTLLAECSCVRGAAPVRN